MSGNDDALYASSLYPPPYYYQEHPALKQPRYRPMGMKNPSQTRVCYLNAMIQVISLASSLVVNNK